MLPISPPASRSPITSPLQPPELCPALHSYPRCCTGSLPDGARWQDYHPPPGNRLRREAGRPCWGWRWRPPWVSDSHPCANPFLRRGFKFLEAAWPGRFQASIRELRSCGGRRALKLNTVAWHRLPGHPSPLSWGNVPVTSRAPHNWDCLLLQLLLTFISRHTLAESPETSFQEESMEPPDFILLLFFLFLFFFYCLFKEQ